MDSSLGLNIFTLLFLSGTFLAALVAGIGGFAFGIVAAGVWLYILSPLQTASLIMGLGLVVQGYSVWKLRDALSWSRLAPLLIGTAFGVPLGVFALAHADPHYLRLGIGVVLQSVWLAAAGHQASESCQPARRFGRGLFEWCAWLRDRSRRDYRRHLVATARLGEGPAAHRISASGGCHFCDERRLAGWPRLDLA